MNNNLRLKLKAAGKKKRGISNVLAEVVLIAITLVMAVPLSGFVFGIFGSFSNPAQVTPTAVTCSLANKECAVTLMNSGGAVTSATACSIYGTAVSLGGVSIAAGSSVQVLCHPPGYSPSAANSLVEGTVALSSGIIVTFYGRWA